MDAPARTLAGTGKVAANVGQLTIGWASLAAPPGEDAATFSLGLGGPKLTRVGGRVCGVGVHIAGDDIVTTAEE